MPVSPPPQNINSLIEARSSSIARQIRGNNPVSYLSVLTDFASSSPYAPVGPEWGAGMVGQEETAVSPRGHEQIEGLRCWGVSGQLRNHRKLLQSCQRFSYSCSLHTAGPHLQQSVPHLLAGFLWTFLLGTLYSIPWKLALIDTCISCVKGITLTLKVIIKTQRN